MRHAVPNVDQKFMLIYKQNIDQVNQLGIISNLTYTGVVISYDISSIINTVRRNADSQQKNSIFIEHNNNLHMLIYKQNIDQVNQLKFTMQNRQNDLCLIQFSIIVRCLNSFTLICISL